MKHIYCLIIALFPAISFGQLTIGGTNPINFVTMVLSSNNVFVSNYLYNGYNGAICYFGANTPHMPFTSGILMTTGNVTNAVGPNNIGNMSFSNGNGSYAPLSQLLHAETYDAAVLSFDATPFGDTLSIEYIFASEEYPEYVGSQFADIMGIFISGPGIIGVQNIARLPDGSPIGVNYVNNGNPGWSETPASPPVNPEYFEPSWPYSGYDVQYDGLTIPLIAKAVVIPNEKYRISIAIADGGDSSYDSGIFIREGGITASMNENSLTNQVNIWYNPSSQYVSIKLNEYMENTTYSVVDLSGKTLEQAALSENKTIDMSAYSSGMYLIRVEGKNGMLSKKIIR